jgi:hypothetical protein
MVCPYLEYREEADGEASGSKEFAVPRAYCTVAHRFVQPMRADVCNDRYALDHERHCEIYREHAASDDR